jgi:transposase
MLPDMAKQKAVPTQHDKKREFVLRQLDAHRMTAVEATTSLSLSERQVRRLLAAFRKEGAEAVVHGNRGRVPDHTLSLDIRERVIALAQTTYAGFNQTHFTEKLCTVEGITISRASVQRILSTAGIRSPRRRRHAKHRSRRERRSQAGMLLQIDGSRHDWLEGRGPYLTLVGAIDDATNEVTAALFRSQEDAHGYMLLFHHIVTERGIPLGVYADRHGIFQRSPRDEETVDEQLAGKRQLTQVGRMFDDLGIELVTAMSPQAKGRIERLWGTLQDRLVSELRLAGATTLDDANAILVQFLPAFNTQFMRMPASEGSAYRPLPARLDLLTIFSFQYSRIVANDNTVSYDKTSVQIPASPQRSSYAKAKTLLCVGLDGSLSVVHNGRRVAYMPSKNPKAEIRVLKR